MMRPKYRVDLRRTDDEGRFPCPKCKTEINPDVNNKEIYDVVEIRMRGDALHSAILDCNKCGSEIELELALKN